MLLINLCIFILIISICLIEISYGDRTKDKMYEPIFGGSACFRRMNGTHQIGCTSNREGTTGVIHFVQTEQDLKYVLKSGNAGPYIPVIPAALFTVPIIEIILNSNKISGIVVYKQNESITHYTHEYQCPNSKSGLENTCSKDWNPYGTGLLYKDFPFPIFYVQNDDDVIKIKDCFEKFNNYSFGTQYERALCSVEISSFMYATTDSPTCIRRSNSKMSLNPVRFCDPIAGDNIWASLHPIAGNETNAKSDMKYIVVAARLDAASMFHEVVPGASSPITGIVTLLSTAQLLKKILPNNDGNYDTNVLFLLINGESFDYIGSQRLLYDMGNGDFPIKMEDNDEKIVPQIRPENISLFVELSQLGHGNKVYTHVYENQTEITDFIDKLRKNYEFGIDNKEGVLPPASLQTFLKNRGDFKGLVIADHGDVYLSNFYNSIYDNAGNMNFEYYPNVTQANTSEIPENSVQKYLTNVATAVAKSVYQEVTKKEYVGKEEVDIAMVNELLHCYLENRNCRVHQAIYKKKLRDAPYDLYAGVTVAAPSLISTLIGLTLAWVTGDVIDTKQRNCSTDEKDYVFKYLNMSKSLDDLNTTLCFRSTMNLLDAVSPAFIIDGYDLKTSNYSTWTESTWHNISVRLFLKPSRSHETMSITIGSMTIVFSMIIVYFIKSTSSTLFPAAEVGSPTSC